MALHQVRDVVRGMQQLDLAVPAPVADALKIIDALLEAHRQVASTIRPAGVAGLPPAEQAAHNAAVTALTTAALAGPVEASAALRSADALLEAQGQTARANRALAVIDFAAGHAATDPLTSATAAEMALVDAADHVFAQLHSLVRGLVDQVPARLALLGGDLPRTAAFGLTANAAAKAAYTSLEHDAQRYAQARVVQRALLNLALVAGPEALATLWPWCQASTGLDVEQDGHYTGEPLARFVWHSTRYHSAIWVPTADQARQVSARREHERTGGMNDYATGYRPTPEETAAFAEATR